MGNHQPTQWMEVGLSTTNTMDGSRAFDNQHNGWEQLFRQLTQWHDGSGFLETKRQHNDQVAPTLAMVSPSWLGFVTAAMSVDELYTSTAPGYWSRVTVSVDIRNTIHAEPVDITGGDQSESAVYAAGTSMRNLSVRYSISSSPTTPASPTAVQESTAPVSHAQSSAPNSPSQIPFYEEVVTQALGASTLPSTATSTATNDYDKQPTLPARNSLILSSSSVVSKPGRITPRKPSRRRAKKTADAAVKLAPYTDYMDPFDVRLDNKAGEDVARTTGYASSTAQNSNAAIAATAKTTKHDTTPAAGTSVSMATASATAPVFQSEEEARAASLQTAVPGPVYNEVSLPKKSEEEAQAESLPAAVPGFVYAEVVACGKVVEPQRVLTNPNAENDGLASDQDSHDSPIRGTASPRNDDTPVEAYSKENKNFDQ
eukprot:scpid82008/ scgid0441/ 